MEPEQQIHVHVPENLARAMREKVEAGEYRNESEMVKEGLQTLLSRDEGVEKWLLAEVLPAYDALLDDPARARSLDEVRAALHAEQAKLLRS